MANITNFGDLLIAIKFANGFRTGSDNEENLHYKEIYEAIPRMGLTLGNHGFRVEREFSLLE